MNTMNLLVTGGCGFIGSHFINYINSGLINRLVNFDALYYCADKENIKKEIRTDDRYNFVKGNLFS